ncbi:MAG TPA: FAD-dependent oxidoreductase [Solirubrobacteraceae bacterium]|nr:FAD-dependent oxidoreductase [Solirubrobacteraceae bacterium]
MTQPNTPSSGHVVIVGGGVAGLEALLALRAIGGDHIAVTLVSQDDRFVDRPMTVAEPFGLGPAARVLLPHITAELGTEFVHGTVTEVDPAERRVGLADGSHLAFDTLIIATGARGRAPFPDAITFGLKGSGAAIREMLDRLRSSDGRGVVFVAPTMTGWLLPLYELALMTARELARSNVNGVRLRLISPEDRPLALFGDRDSQRIARLMAAAEIEFVGAAFADADDGVSMNGARSEMGSDYVVTLPLLSGPGIAGVPATHPHGFIPVDEYGRVRGLADVYAAGDAVDFPVKQGGLAAQQADAVAEHVAARYGAAVELAPFRPVLRGMLFTGGEPVYMRSGAPGADPEVPGAWCPLWWPPTKIAGRHLAPYLFAREDEGVGFGSPPVGFIDVDIPLAAMTLPA